MLKLILPLMSLTLVLTTNYAWWLSFLIMLILSFYSLMWFNPSSFQSVISSYSTTDPMSSMLMILSVVITTLMIIASVKIYMLNSNKLLFIVMSLLLLLTLILCFSSNSMISFYIWFEASLVPTLMIISIWGYQPERIQAGMYLMMYTITASLPMFLMFMIIFNHSNSSLMLPCLPSIPQYLNFNIFMLLLVTGFIVKLPMFTTHLWLPKAHVEAPIAGSMILAAILLKLGGYGLVRIMSLFQFINIPSKLLLSVALYGAVITSFICLRQPDMKSMIAYSSVGHMGIMLAGIMAMSQWGMSGAIMMMMAHGLCSSALFILANLSYSSTHTRSVYLTKGMMVMAPIMSMWWFLMLSANMAAPPTLNLLSEIMLITSITSTSSYSMIVLALLSFFTATYSLHMFAITQHGQMPIMLNPTQSIKMADMLILFLHLSLLLILIFKPNVMIS